MRNFMTIYSSFSSEADTDANGLQIRQMAGSYIHAGQATLVWWSIKFHHMLTTQLCHSSRRIHKQWHVAIFIILNIPSGFITQSDSYLHMVIFHFIACFLLRADNRHPSQHVCISLAGFKGGGVSAEFKRVPVCTIYLRSSPRANWRPHQEGIYVFLLGNGCGVRIHVVFAALRVID